MKTKPKLQKLKAMKLIESVHLADSLSTQHQIWALTIFEGHRVSSIDQILQARQSA